MRRVSHRLLVLAALVPLALVADALAGAATAEASGCFFGPYIQTDSPPVGCPVSLLRSVDHAPLTDPPRVQVIRDDEWVELTATVTARSEVSLEVGYYETDCDGHVVSTRFDQEPYAQLTLDVEGAQPLDQLYVDNIPAGTIAATGACADPATAPAPTPSCSGNYEGCPYNDPPGDEGDLGDDARVGCMSAGGGSMDLALVVLVGAFVAGARRRRRASSTAHTTSSTACNASSTGHAASSTAHSASSTAHTASATAHSASSTAHTASSSAQSTSPTARRAAILGALAIAVLAPRVADASGCYRGPNLLSSSTPRLGCPIVIAQDHLFGGADPTLRVLRDTDNLDVTGTVTKEERQVPMSWFQLDCDGLVVGETQTSEPYDIYSIELSAKAQAGDTLLVDGITSPIQPADPDVPCDALIEPMPSCNIMADMCDYDYDDDMNQGDDTASVGCLSAGGGAGNAGTVLLVLGLVAVGRRVRRR